MPLTFLSIDLVETLKIDEPGAPSVSLFDVVIGSLEGQVLHGQIEIDNESGEILKTPFINPDQKQFQAELQIPDGQPITEVKLHFEKDKDIYLLLLISGPKLY